MKARPGLQLEPVRIKELTRALEALDQDPTATAEQRSLRETYLRGEIERKQVAEPA